MAKPMSFQWRVFCWYLLAVCLVLLDQLTKLLASAYLSYGQPLVILPVFNLTLLHNTGAAFSFLSDAGGWQRWFFGAIALGVSTLLVVWLGRLPKNAWLQGVALSFILGGALGNLWDRVTLGYVVDFVQLHYREYYFPAFNLADSAITLGAILLIAESLFCHQKQKAPSHG